MPYPCFAPPARLARISIDGSENRPKFNSFIGLSSPKNIGTTYISPDVTTSNVIYMQTSSSVKSFGVCSLALLTKKRRHLHLSDRKCRPASIHFMRDLPVSSSLLSQQLQGDQLCQYAQQ